MGEACNTHYTNGKCNVTSRIIWKKEHLEDLAIDVRII
jgi:hypothetical protein